MYFVFLCYYKSEIYITNKKKTSSDQFGAYSLAKIFLYFEILTWSPSLNLGYFLLKSSLYSA